MWDLIRERIYSFVHTNGAYYSKTLCSFNIIHYSTHLLLSIQSIGSVLAHVCILFLIPQTLTERFTSCCFVTLSPIPASIATELDHAQKFPNFVILFVTNGLLFYWYICDINIVSISRSNEDIVKVKLPIIVAMHRTVPVMETE